MSPARDRPHPRYIDQLLAPVKADDQGFETMSSWRVSTDDKLLREVYALPLLAQTKSIDTREILKLEDEFALAMMKNDPEAIGRPLADDRIVIDPDGGIVDRARFLG